MANLKHVKSTLRILFDGGEVDGRMKTYTASYSSIKENADAESLKTAKDALVELSVYPERVSKLVVEQEITNE